MGTACTGNPPALRATSLQREALVRCIFDGAYSGRLIASATIIFNSFEDGVVPSSKFM